MLVPNEVQKCAVFLLYVDKSTMSFKFGGTAFVVALKADVLEFIYLVTAHHIIKKIWKHSANAKVYVRINGKIGGSFLIESSASEWRVHPNDKSVDIAMLPFSADPKIFEYTPIPITMFVTPQVIQSEGIGVGDEVYITSLFDSHGLKPRNISIVKGGHIASMPEEPVNIEHYGSINTYLVETASIGSLIGSPVFVHLGVVRLINQQITFFQQSDPYAGTCYFLGLMQGPLNIVTDDLGTGRVNHGIAIVVPAMKILEIIDQPEWVTLRRKIISKERKNRVFTEMPPPPVQDSDDEATEEEKS